MLEPPRATSKQGVLHIPPWGERERALYVLLADRVMEGLSASYLFQSATQSHIFFSSKSIAGTKVQIAEIKAP
jgi:hypothetical protein